MCMYLVLESTFSVRSDESDMYGRIRLSSLINIFIQAAIKASSKYGFGFDVLRKNNLTWMLSRISVEIYDKIQWNETIKVKTWPKTIDGLLYIRDFIAYNSENKIIAKCTTGWIAVDYIRKRITTVDFLNDNFTSADKTALDYMPLKIDETQIEQKFEITSTYFDIDLNKHVTAVRYIDWMMDTFDVEYHQANYPKKVHINYLKEILIGNKIELGKKQITENSFYFSAKNKSTGKKAFRAILSF